MPELTNEPDAGERHRSRARALAPVMERADLCADYCRERDVPCPGCGYNMRGTTHGICPECNWVMEIGVLRANRDQRPALWMSCAWCLATGGLTIAVPLTVSLVCGFGPSLRGIRMWATAAAFISMFAYAVLGVGALCLTRRRAFRGAHRWLAIGWVLLGAYVVAQVAPWMG